MAQTLLDVFLHECLAGTLSVAGGRLSFTYAGAYLASPIATPLSLSLPLQASPFDDKRSRPFFAGLLPEGTMRRLLAKQFGVSVQNDFALLGQIGGECAGAVRLMPSGLPHAALDSRVRGNDGGAHIQWLEDDALLALLKDLPRRPMLAGQDGLRLSLAGAQDKLPVCARISAAGRIQIGLPLGGLPSTHIIKPAIESIEDSVRNESFCLNLAFALGLNSAKAQVVTLGDVRFLLVERYDRRFGNDNHLERLHQEDFCQALGIVPEQKYQNEGGPGFALCFDLLRRTAQPSAPEVLRLLDFAIFSWLIGNHDAHGKNYSLLYEGRAPKLAPLYDVLCTAIYPTLTSKMAMKLGSKYTFEDLAARHFEQFAHGAGLSPAQTKHRILALAHQLPTLAKALQATPSAGYTNAPITDKIIDLLIARSASLQRLFSL